MKGARMPKAKTSVANEIQSWIVSRGPARGGGWHIQCRTIDQFSSFAVVIPEKLASACTIQRGESTKPGIGTFSLVFLIPVSDYHATINLLGKIRYDGDWNGIA